VAAVGGVSDREVRAEVERLAKDYGHHRHRHGGPRLGLVKSELDLVRSRQLPHRMA